MDPPSRNVKCLCSSKYLLLLPLIIHLNQRLATFIKTTAQLKKKGLDLLLYKIWSQLRDRLGHLPPQDSEPIYSAMSIHVVFCSLLFKT